jgi:hypothetical protein
MASDAGEVWRFLGVCAGPFNQRMRAPRLAGKSKASSALAARTFQNLDRCPGNERSRGCGCEGLAKFVGGDEGASPNIAGTSGKTGLLIL